MLFKEDTKMIIYDTAQLKKTLNELKTSLSLLLCLIIITKFIKCMIRTFYCWKSGYRTKIIFLQLWFILPFIPFSPYPGGTRGCSSQPRMSCWATRPSPTFSTLFLWSLCQLYYVDMQWQWINIRLVASRLPLFG